MIKSTDDFIRIARSKHGDKYDYSKADYVNANNKVIIICKEHGEFLQIPRAHTYGKGCPVCGRIKLVSHRTFSKDDFIKKSREKHGDKYDYSLVNYVNNKAVVDIICPVHGLFHQIANAHMNGSGCVKCININKRFFKRLSLEDFLIRANDIHDNKYDYSLVKFNKSDDKIKIICPIHGMFEQKVSPHINGAGCIKCGVQRSKLKQSISWNEWLSRFNEVHNHKYDYIKPNEFNSNSYIEVVCKKHGTFKVQIIRHSTGTGCKQCSYDQFSSDNSIDLNEFVRRSKTFHGDKYDYSKSVYVNQYDKIIVICPEHGEFQIIPKKHFNGVGCPRCRDSSLESAIRNHVESNYNGVIINNDRKVLDGIEIDIFLPNLNFGIECNGTYWHSYNFLETTEQRYRHYNKVNLAVSKEIHLIQIMEDEWINQCTVVKSIINNHLGLSYRIYGRKCVIKNVSDDDYRNFCVNHIQGYRGASVIFGLYYENELVSIMSFGRHAKYEWEIIRYCNKLNCSVIGGASKLFKHFVNVVKPAVVLTYADRRYSAGNLYRKLGFNDFGITKPNYKYVKNGNLYSRQQFQKHKLFKKLELFDVNLTESENMFRNGYRRIWDAGNYRFLYKNVG